MTSVSQQKLEAPGHKVLYLLLPCCGCVCRIKFAIAFAFFFLWEGEAVKKGGDSIPFLPPLNGTVVQSVCVL